MRFFITPIDKIIIIVIIIIMIYEYSKKEKTIAFMGQIVSKLRRIADSKLKESGLTFTQFGTLFAMLQHSGMNMSQRELADYLATDTTTIMVVCDSLEKKGHIKRVPDTSDRRINRLEITDTGKKSIEKALPLVYEVFGPVSSSFSDDEADALYGILEKIGRALFMEK